MLVLLIFALSVQLVHWSVQENVCFKSKLQDGHIDSKNADRGWKMPFFKIKAVKMQKLFFLQVHG